MTEVDEKIEIPVRLRQSLYDLGLKYVKANEKVKSFDELVSDALRDYIERNSNALFLEWIDRRMAEYLIANEDKPKHGRRTIAQLKKIPIVDISNRSVVEVSKRGDSKAQAAELITDELEIAKFVIDDLKRIRFGSTRPEILQSKGESKVPIEWVNQSGKITDKGG
jgi:hypothetical protein